MKKVYYVLSFVLFYFLWVKVVTFLYDIPIEPDYPMLRARLGTIMYHSSGSLNEVEGVAKDSNIVAHTYCYYPKSEAKSNLIIKRQDDGCSQWYGQVVFYEASYVSEREKYWWSKEQHIQDCAGCDDLLAKK